MNVFPYLVPAFGNIAASKEYSLTRLYVGEAQKKETSLTDVKSFLELLNL